MEKEILDGFCQLGKLMRSLGSREDYPGYEIGVTEDEFNQLNILINRQFSYNGWFTKENVKQSLLALSEWLIREKLSSWTSTYDFASSSKKIAVIMAGNIPLVGFHDFLSVLISGNSIVCKLSSEDKTLLPALTSHLVNFTPVLKDRISFGQINLNEIDGVIATGSNNSHKYFESYFGSKAHIFRKNRTSVAVLTGNESNQELFQLGNDIFNYFGLGCRNVSHLLLPQNYLFETFFEGIFKHSEVINHNKYGNNYDYNKAVYLMNQHRLLDNNFVLLRESTELFSPIGMLHYHFYSSKDEVNEYIEQNENDIQVTVGSGFTPFGNSQKPTLSDYPDGIDVLKWINELR